MIPDQLRAKLMERIDAILSRPFLVWGKDRTILSAVRDFAATMTTEELERLQKFMPSTQKETSMNHNHTEAECCCNCIGHLAQAVACCCAHAECCAADPAKKQCCDECCKLIVAALEKCVANLKVCCC